MRKACTLLLIALVGCENQAPPTELEMEDRFRAVNDRGEILTEFPEDWPCVTDLITGLDWEVKTRQPGLHHFENTYSWYNPTETVDELDYRGTANAGTCQDSACDTHAWVNAVNEAGLCGHHDWRLASRDELASLSVQSRNSSPPTIDTHAFPLTQAAEYWSSNDYSFQWNAAWVWSYEFGHDRVEWKASPRLARLVRGDGVNLMRVKD